jgi:lipoprotein NlpD
MRAVSPPRRACARTIAASLWTCVALSWAHAEEVPAPAPVASAAVGSEPRAPDDASAGRPSSPSCGGATSAKAPAFRWPARGAVTSPFGMRGKRPHEGIDISYRAGMAVRAAATGTVVFSDTKSGYGRVIVLRHPGGYETLYAHNSDNLVRPGARVEQGELIADMGSSGEASGPHLHFEIRVGGRPVDPLFCLPAQTQAR